MSHVSELVTHYRVQYLTRYNFVWEKNLLANVSYCSLSICLVGWFNKWNSLNFLVLKKFLHTNKYKAALNMHNLLYISNTSKCSWVMDHYIKVCWEFLCFFTKSQFIGYVGFASIVKRHGKTLGTVLLKNSYKVSNWIICIV